MLILKNNNEEMNYVLGFEVRQYIILSNCLYNLSLFYYYKIFDVYYIYFIVRFFQVQILV